MGRWTLLLNVQCSGIIRLPQHRDKKVHVELYSKFHGTCYAAFDVVGVLCCAVLCCAVLALTCFCVYAACSAVRAFASCEADDMTSLQVPPTTGLSAGMQAQPPLRTLL